MTGDMPTIGNSIYGASNSTFALGGHGLAAADLGIGAQRAVKTFLIQPAVPTTPKPEKQTMSARRLVQVFIADPDENVPLDKSLIYSGEQKFTDATDQELYFEIDIKAILEAHNAERIQFVNKKVKERTEFLEPVKIRDLKMVVVNVATF